MAKTEQLGEAMQPSFIPEIYTTGKELSLRERVLRAVDDKILEDPFYSGENSVFLGLSTPLRRRASDTQYAAGITPEEFCGLDEFTGRSSTPEEFYQELEYERKVEAERDSNISAEEMFEGTDVVLRDPSNISHRPDGTRINWKSRQHTWKRNWEIVGEHIGTGSTLADMAQREGITREAVRQICVKNKATMLSCLGLDKMLQESDKPQRLWNRRDELADPKSRFSEFIDDLEKGVDASELKNKWGSNTVHQYREFINELEISEKVPYEKLMLNPIFREEFAELDDPELNTDRKRKLLGRITRSFLDNYAKNVLHVTGLMSVLKYYSKEEKDEISKPLLYLDGRSLKRVMQILERENIIIHSLPASSKKKAYFHYVANGDIRKIRDICKSEDKLSDLRVPTVVAYGNHVGKVPNTNDLQKGHRAEVYRKVNGLIGKLITEADRTGLTLQEAFKDFPVALFATRKGKYFVNLSEKEELEEYVEGLGN